MKPLSNTWMKQTLLSFLITLPGTLWAQNALDKTGNPTATPVVAFSVRQLSSAYTGPAMQVRRSSDNQPKDIPFTPSGDLDTAFLKSFVGADTGYVTVWYDQSGNGLNAIQPKATTQPTIIINRMINRDNGQPSVYTYGAAGYLYYQPVSQLTSQVTRMEVCRNRSGAFEIIEGLGYFQLDLEMFPDHLWVQYENGNITIPTTTVTTTTNLMSINSVRNSTASQLYVNTILQGTNPATLSPLAAPDTGFIGIRWDNSGSNSDLGAFSETMLFGSVLSDADRQSINYNENWYYSLGFDPCSSTQAALSPNGMTDRALYACMQDASYAYYYDPSNPLNLLFGIAKDPGNTGANSTFQVDSVNPTVTAEPSSIIYSATSGMEGIFALGRYWNVYTHTPLTSPVNVRFFYKPSDTIAALTAAQAFKSSSGATNISNLQWFKTIGGPFNKDSLTATPKAAIKGPYINLTPIYGRSPNGINYVEFDGVTSFSGGTGVYIVSNSFVTLPVIISSFTGRRVKATSVLSWATESESNTDHFELYRSSDGNTWIKAGQTAAAGNSSAPTPYRYMDTASLQPGKSLYYRLRLVYMDGQYTYSGVLLLEDNNNTSTAAAAQPLKITPNPFANTMELICTVPNNGPVEVQLQDVTGAILIRQKYIANKGNNILTLTNLAGLAQGIYIVRVVQGATIGIGKAIKQ